VFQPSNCDIAVAAVVVTNNLDAVNDSFSPSSSIVKVPGSVITNDRLNGILVNTTNTDVTTSNCKWNY
jgi:hypothetical protein